VNEAALALVKTLDADNCSAAPIISRNASATIQLNFHAYSFDAYENCIGAATGDWTKSFTDPQLSFDSSATAAHSMALTPIIDGQSGTITFDDGSGNTFISTLSIFNSVADHFLVTGLDTEGNYTVTTGANHRVLLEARDSFGNVSNSYSGSKNLAWSSNATALVPPTALALGTVNPVNPTSTNYTFNNGILSAAAPNIN
jgi:hypothetical protein